jgi:hypothetical protein
MNLNSLLKVKDIRIVILKYLQVNELLLFGTTCKLNLEYSNEEQVPFIILYLSKKLWKIHEFDYICLEKI